MIVAPVCSVVLFPVGGLLGGLLLGLFGCFSVVCLWHLFSKNELFNMSLRPSNKIDFMIYSPHEICENKWP